MRTKAVHLCTLAVCFAVTANAFAQRPSLTDPANLSGERVAAPVLADTLDINHGPAALEQLLRKLRTRASFMLIVAHPDDEDGGMLTYLSRGQGARVAMLTLNRGEGGQNLMSGDFEDALGLIRTQELLAADRYMAVDQMFGSEVDFGFSKTKEEAFRKWTHDRVLYDAVRAVRLYRPLVIGSVFIGSPSDGHGQHQVAGEIAQEVFNAAGDPNVFPEQIADGLEPWQPLKVYARVPFARIDAQGMYDSATGQYTPARFTNYVSGKLTTTVPIVNVVVPEGTPDTLLGGLSYVQFAREGLALQKTQIGRNIRLAGPGTHDVGYHRYGSHVAGQGDGEETGQESNFFDGIDTSLTGISSHSAADVELREALGRIDAQIIEAQRKFNPARPGAIASELREALHDLDGAQQMIRQKTSGSGDEAYNVLHELKIKRVQLNDALLLADGITLKATLAQTGSIGSLLTTTQQIGVNTTLITGDEQVELESINLNFLGRPVAVKPEAKAATALHVPAHLAANSTRRQPLKGIVDHELPATRPYFSRSNIEQPYYDIADSSLRNAPATPAPLMVSATLLDHGVRLMMEATVSDGAMANEPAEVVPPVTVSLPVTAAVIPVEQHSFPIRYSAFNPEPSFAPQFRLELPALWSYSVPDALNPAPAIPAVGRVSMQTATVNIFEPGPYQRNDVTVVTSIHGQDYREGYRSVGYAGLQPTNFYSPTVFHVTAVDLATAPGLNVGYIPGTGDSVPAALEDLGIHPHALDAAGLTAETLKVYDAVILGVRAYEHSNLGGANAALNAYAAGGGVVIAQYNTGNLPAGTGPYSLSLGDNEKVVEEDARVRILFPATPILSWPNQITPSDFEHWVEERGHGFMSTWDPKYQALLETHDAGQQPQRGGLLVARTGKGAWIYLGLALYRQLPEGVPGAYRILANLVSAGKNVPFLSTQTSPLKK